MTTDLIPAENTAAIEALSPADREVAVTHMLTEARDWLAHAKDATGPAEIANFKAWTATVAQMTKQLNLSKEIQLDAQEMVRRAERGVGVAIREGQERGDVRTSGQYEGASAPYTRTRLGVTQDIEPAVREQNSRLSPKALLPNSSERVEIYAVAEASDDDFDTAIGEAKAEGNLSRANVLRKVRANPDSPGYKTRQQRADLIRDLAGQGYGSRQMPSKVGVTEESVRLIARDFDIQIPADKATVGTRRINATDVVEGIVATYEMATSGESAINWSEVDPTRADEWVNSLTESISAASAFRKKIKELTYV